MRTTSSTMQETVSSQYAKTTPSRQGKLSPPSSVLTWIEREKARPSSPATTSTQPRVSALTGPSWPGSPGTIPTCPGTEQNSGLPGSSPTVLWRNPRRWQEDLKNPSTSPNGPQTASYTSAPTGEDGGTSIASTTTRSSRSTRWRVNSASPNGGLDLTLSSSTLQTKSSVLTRRTGSG